MVGNQMASETTITSANNRAWVQQAVADRTLRANIALRGMELVLRDVWQSKNPAELDKQVDRLNSGFAVLTGELDAAIANVARPEDKDRLQTIRSLGADYHKSASDIGKAQLKILDITKKRAERSAEWTKTFEGFQLSPALIRASNRTDIEKVLNEADSNFNSVQAATWRLIATGDESEKHAIVNRTGGLEDTLDTAKSIINDAGLRGTIDGLANTVKGFSAVTGEAIEVEAAKKALFNNKALPAA